jgi:hypothetical protein
MLELMNESTGTSFRVLDGINDHAATPTPPSELPVDYAPEAHMPAGDALDPTPLPAPLPETKPTLEERVHQLEDQVAGLQDTRKLEDRLTERVARRLERKQANTAIKAPVAAVAEATKPPPLARIAPPPELPSVVVLEGKTSKQSWLILDIFSEFRAMLRMFLDVRYRIFYMKWQTKLYPVILLSLIVLSGLTISSIPLVGPVLDRVAELIIAFSLYKVLSREANRYKEIEPQMRR